MWLLVIEIVMAIVAAARGWKFWPFLIIGSSFVLGLLLGPGATQGTFTFLAIIDWIITAVLIGMAIVGRKKAPEPGEQISSPSGPSSSRVSCPYCAEMILPDAKICRYCGKELNPERSSHLPSGF